MLRLSIPMISAAILLFSSMACGEQPSRNTVPPPPAELSCEFLKHPTKTVIFDPQPEFAWMCGTGETAFTQSAYRVQLKQDSAADDAASELLWDTERVASDQSINVEYAGPPLLPGGSYSWRVQVWNSEGQPSEWSSPQSFVMADKLSPELTSRYPVEATTESPEQLKSLESGGVLVDFGRDAFGYLKLSFESPVKDSFTMTVNFGERMGKGRIDANPGGTIRYYSVQVEVEEGASEIEVRPPVDHRNTHGDAVTLPKQVGVVAPFRYVELLGAPDAWKSEQISRVRIDYPFDMSASHFESSDEVLNAIWELCKYSIRATSFCGVYVDGDRERIPYEADAYINQLAHYGVDQEYALARYSHEYLMKHSTWPTEWKQHSVLIAWEDYMYTGNTESLQKCYAQLKSEKHLSAAERADGLLDTSGDGYRDIVDWPQAERDGYEMLPVNTVVNAFHFATLERMARIAEVLSLPDDSKQFADKAAAFKEMFNRKLWDARRRCYLDGEGSEHASLHANLFPLAFEVVPEEQVASVARLLDRRGMRCSVYAAQYLLEGLYLHGESEQALNLLRSEDKRSWFNMIRVGSTITLEAWDQQYKPNLDWNHAWGAAPANLIPRYLVGVRPGEAGFKKVIIQPQPGSLEKFEAKVPTIRGPVQVEFQRTAQGYTLNVSVPGNSTADIGLPEIAGQQVDSITLNGKKVQGTEQGGILWIQDVPPGVHAVQVGVDDIAIPQSEVTLSSAAE
ncbi:alpha-L-rhamnosidase-related protein [Aeoliella mucimassa]|nr:alpha-L-rhamnosidase C-terminal domain-containing protein [Aeoliella mucimassa]